MWIITRNIRYGPFFQKLQPVIAPGALLLPLGADLGKLENGKFNFMCGSHSSISGSSCFGMLLPTFSVYFSFHQTLGTVVIAILVVSFVVSYGDLHNGLKYTFSH